MKRSTIILWGVVLMFILACCGSTQGSASAAPLNGKSAAQQEKTKNDIKETASGSSVLVVYFSRTGEQYRVGVIEKGNTAIVAEMIAEATGADSFEIFPEKDHYPYTYNELTEAAKKEQRQNARPAYAGKAPDIARYDTVFIGAPVWWGDWPMICYTFFEKEADALDGKTVIPFSTHEGSGLSGFDRKLSSVLPNCKIGKGLAISGSDAQNSRDKVRNAVKNWLSKLGY